MNGSRGITLIETIVYAAILALISAAVINSLIITVKSFNRARFLARIDNSAETSMERIIREIRLANEINPANSVLGSNPGRLFLETRDGSGASTTIDFFLNNGKIYVSEAGGPAEQLTSSDTEVTNLVFTGIDAIISDAIKIEMTLKSGQGNFEKSETFYGAAVLRGSY